MRKTISATGLLLVLCVALFDFPAFADAYHYNDNLVGERAMGMGGAFTALSNEISGAYYNPAGLIGIDDDYISLSLSIYQFRSQTVKDYRGGKSLTSNSINIIPSSLGTVYSFGDHRWGFSIMVPEYNDVTMDFHDTESVPALHANRNTKAIEYMAGPSLSFFINSKFSVGATLYGYYRNDKDYISVLRESENVFKHDITSSDKKMIGIMPVFGVLYKPWDVFSLGISLRAGLQIYGSATFSTTHTTNALGLKPVVFEEQNKVNAQEFPIVARTGFAFKIWKGNTTTFDIIFADPIIYRSAGTVAELEPTFNFAVGIEQLISSLWSLRAGFYTDFTSAPGIDISRPNPPPHIDLLGGTLGVGIDGAFTTTTVGLNGAYGTGHSFQNAKILGVEEYYIGVFFGGSFRYHTEDEIDALKRWFDIDLEEEERERERERERRKERRNYKYKKERSSEKETDSP